MKIGGSVMIAIGGLLVILAFLYETSVASSLLDEYSGRTMNIGLMQEQQNILITGLCAALCGFILLVGGYIVEQLESINISNRSMLIKEVEKSKEDNQI